MLVYTRLRVYDMNEEHLKKFFFKIISRNLHPLIKLSSYQSTFFLFTEGLYTEWKQEKKNFYPILRTYTIPETNLYFLLHLPALMNVYLHKRTKHRRAICRWCLKRHIVALLYIALTYEYYDRKENVLYSFSMAILREWYRINDKVILSSSNYFRILNPNYIVGIYITFCSL